MYRRTLLQRMSGLLALIPFSGLRLRAQTAVFPGEYGPVLRELALIVLPSALGKTGTEEISNKFERYVREYRPGADMDHGYGFTHVVPKPASPAQLYRQQLAALPSPLTRAVVEEALETLQVKDLPRIPNGKNIIVDLMSFYFRSSDANDLCYNAAIGRDRCRGLAGSEHPPAPFKKFA